MLTSFHLVLIFFATWFGDTFGTMFGGGSFFIQPALLLAGIAPHAAVANDVAAAFPSCAFFAFLMHRQGHVEWRAVKWMAPVALVGAIVGSSVLTIIPAAALIWMVIVFCSAGLIYTIHRVRQARKSGAEATGGFRYWRGWQLAAIPAALLLGLYEGVSAAGSGVLIMTLLAFIFRANTKALISTANAVGAVSLFTATLMFWRLGLLDFRLLAVMVPATVLGAWSASWIVKMAPEPVLRAVFAGVSFAVICVLLTKQLAPAVG